MNGCGKQQPWYNLRYYPVICFERLSWFTGNAWKAPEWSKSWLIHGTYVMKMSFSKLPASTEQNNKCNFIFDKNAYVWNKLTWLQRSLLFTEFLPCSRYADYISLMSFDYHTATSDNVTGLNSPLHAVPGENPNNKLNVVSVFQQSIFLLFLFKKNNFISLCKQTFVVSFPTESCFFLCPSMVWLTDSNRFLQCRINLKDVNLGEIQVLLIATAYKANVTWQHRNSPNFQTPHILTGYQDHSHIHIPGKTLMWDLWMSQF
jgi:hypothetical protein